MSDEVKVRSLESADRERWDSYVLAHPGGTFFHLSGWQSVIKETLGHDVHYLIAETDSRIVGVLPLARVRSFLFGDALISVPFLVYGGPVADSTAVTGQLVDEAERLAVQLGVDHLEFRNTTPVTDWPSKDTHVTFRRPIEADPEANLKAIPRKQRAVVRKAMKRGLQAELDSDVDRLYDTLSECKRNLGTPFFGERYLRAVKTAFGDDCEIQIITSEDAVVAGVMSFRFREQILPYYGGGGAAARQLGANDFMYWKVMEKACHDGLTVFDFGRSQIGSGAYKFKKYWGFEPQPLSYEVKLVGADELPNVDPNSKRYQQLVKIWSKLPLPVARTLGPRIARLLG